MRCPILRPPAARPGARRPARHAHGPRYGGALDADGRHLSRSGHEGADPGGGAGGQGRDLGAADRASQEERHGARSRAAARGHGLAAAGAAHQVSRLQRCPWPVPAQGLARTDQWLPLRCSRPFWSRATPTRPKLSRRISRRPSSPARQSPDRQAPSRRRELACLLGRAFLMGRPGAPQPARAAAPAQSRLRRMWGAERAGDERRGRDQGEAGQAERKPLRGQPATLEILPREHGPPSRSARGRRAPAVLGRRHRWRWSKPPRLSRPP